MDNVATAVKTWLESLNRPQIFKFCTLFSAFIFVLAIPEKNRKDERFLIFFMSFVVSILCGICGCFLCEAIFGIIKHGIPPIVVFFIEVAVAIIISFIVGSLIDSWKSKEVANETNKTE